MYKSKGLLVLSSDLMKESATHPSEHHSVVDSIFTLYLGTLSPDFGSEINHNEDLLSSVTDEATTLNICVI
jgi:hypothetical protein